MADSYNNLALMYYETQRYQEAEESYKKAVEIQKRLSKRNAEIHEPDLAVSYYRLVLVYEAREKYSDAQIYKQKALELARIYPYDAGCRRILELVNGTGTKPYKAKTWWKRITGRPGKR